MPWLAFAVAQDVQYAVSRSAAEGNVIRNRTHE